VPTHALIVSPRASGMALNLAWKTVNTATTARRACSMAGRTARR
jgi:hypothetical protein